MKILSVKAKNFRSYAEISWKLESSDLHLIDGSNLDTKRSNMTGKTTLIDSIFWGLFGYLPKWDGPKGGSADAVIKRGTSNCWVEVTFENNGDTYQVVRTRPASVSVTKNQGSIPGKKNDLDSRIPEFLGMSAAQFLLAVYVSQDRSTSFFTMSDAERTQMLSVIAGLESLNKALEKVKAERTEIQTNLDRLAGVVQVLENRICHQLPRQSAHLSVQLQLAQDDQNKAQSVLEQLGYESQLMLMQFEVDTESRKKNVIETREAKLFDLSKEFKTISEQIVKKHYEISTFEASAVYAGDHERELWLATQELKKIDENNNFARLITAKNADILRQIQRELDQAEKVHENCDRCGQSLPEEATQSVKLSHIRKASELEGRIEKAPAEIDRMAAANRITEIQKKIAEQNAGPDAIRAQLSAELRSLEMLATQNVDASDKANDQANAEIKSLQDEQSRLRRDFESKIFVAQSNVRLKEQAVQHAKKAIESHKAEQESAEKELTEAKRQEVALSQQMDETSDLIDLFGPKGLRVIYFDSIIQRIGERAGELLSLMTDGVYSTRIDQVGENSKGEQKLILRPVITKGGIEVPMDDLSGAGRRTAMLAYDVAVAEAVGESNVLFLDEAMDGLDAIGKMEALRLLKEVSKTRAVYLTDHTSEVKSSISNVLSVTYRDGTSFLESDDTPMNDQEIRSVTQSV